MSIRFRKMRGLYSVVNLNKKMDYKQYNFQRKCCDGEKWGNVIKIKKKDESSNKDG